MVRRGKNWLQRPNVTWQWVASAVVLWTVALVLLDGTQVSEDLENKVSRPLDFRVREELGRSPKIDDSIKVYGIDDSTVSWIGSPSPTVEQWARLIAAFAARKPRSIIIDGMFTIANIAPGDEQKTAEAVKAIEDLDVPVIVGSFIAPRKLRFREPLDLSSPSFDLSKLLAPGMPTTALDGIPFAPAGSSHVYGPDPRLRKVFRLTGHIHYSGDGRVMPYYRLEGSRGVPHFVLQMPPSPKIRDGRLTIGDADVFLYRDGSIPLNFNSYATYLQRTRPLMANMVRAMKGEPIPEVNEGDTVYIMPAFYTGNTDFKLTPFGIMPAGYAHLALINSVLTRQWLKPLWAKEILIFLGALAGAAIAVRCGPVVVGLGLVGGIGLWVGLSLYLFSFHGFMLPWMIPAIAYVGTLVSVFVEKTRMAEKKSQFIRHALDGVISPKTLKAIAKNPEQLNFEARERVVTIMFIDVVGFSLIAENQLPRVAFDQLKAIMGDIIRMVHDHGGIVNKNLGDGLLCFFGYSLETDESTYDHAEKAFECASEIQRSNLPKTIRAFERGEPVYPLRIGLNTASVFLGNIGTEDRLDFTIIGNGVNFAKRLEAACETHSVLMSATTKELIDPIGAQRSGMKKQYIQIKHHAESIEAFAFDPFHDQSGMRERAMNAYESSTNAARLEERWDVRDRGRIKVLTQVGAGELVRFTASTLNVLLPTPLVSQAMVRVALDTVDGNLRRDLANAGIEWLETEVTFTFEEDKGTVHGLKIKNLSDEATNTFLSVLKRYVDNEDLSVKLAG